MSSDVIFYKKDSQFVGGGGKTVLDKGNTNGIECIWSANMQVQTNYTKFQWDFNWDDLEEKGVEKLIGSIVVRMRDDGYMKSEKLDVELTASCQSVEHNMMTGFFSAFYASYEFSLTPHYSLNEESKIKESMFQASDKTDGILLVEGKKLHINKQFLAFHSDFFNSLFTSKFAESGMNEIPINDVSYKDFSCLLALIYPEVVYPTDKNAQTLLELADRFLMPGVIRQVEHHLLHHSKIQNTTLLVLSDRYKMKQLRKMVCDKVTTVVEAKMMRQSPKYENFSNETKALLFDRILELQ